MNTYGLTVYANGSGSRVNGEPWTLEELQQLQIAVQYTASAFNRLKYNNPSGTDTQAKQLFRSIMLLDGSINLDILRVTNQFIFGGDECDGSATEGCAGNRNNVITFYGNFYIDPNNVIDVSVAQYAIVHKFGHRFNNQSQVDVEPDEALSDHVDGQGVVIQDCNGDRVMGRAAQNPEWVRGARG